MAAALNGIECRQGRLEYGGRPIANLKRYAPVAIHLLFWTSVLVYTVVFSLLSLQQYHAFLPHALDLGNMAQAAWNTVHLNLFRYQNQRLHINFEAFGTTSRLSAHVEPIFPVISVVYYFWQHVETLLVLQTVAIAAGALPVRLLARRRLGPGLPEIVFPLAYLLFPALEAANLDEFHPVALAAPLLLWAFYLADIRRYSLFVLLSLAAIGCKEEIGVVVGGIAIFWIALRNGDRRFGVIVAILSVTWSLLALKIVVPHFSGGESSYWARYLPPGYPVARYPVTQADILQYWLHHPMQVLDDLRSEAKLSYMHRLLVPFGYMSLVNPVTLLAGIPSLLLVLLSEEPHMYSGLAHYSVELVPVIVVAAILGTELLSKLVVARLRVSSTVAVAACCLYVLASSIANHRVNGFSPLAESFIAPAVTAHDKLLDQVLHLIPAGASVSAQDALNAHLSDRGRIFLFPDLDHNHVQYIGLDTTLGTGSAIRPCDLYTRVIGEPFPAPAAPLPCDTAVSTASNQLPTHTSRSADQRAAAYSLLHSGRWIVRFARDGILLLEQRKPRDPTGSELPAAFYSFVTPATGTPAHRVVARFGDFLELEGFSIARREVTNLRNPDVVVTTWWRALKASPRALTIMHYLSDSTGALQNYASDQQATDWLPIAGWQPGQTYMVKSTQLTVKTNKSGRIDVDLGLTPDPGTYMNTTKNLQIRLIHDAGTAALVGPCGCNMLRLGHIDDSL